MQSVPNDAAFRQRKYYWRKKGLSESDAIQKALNSRKTAGGTKLSLVPPPSKKFEKSNLKNDRKDASFFDASRLSGVLISLFFITLCSGLLIFFTAPALGKDLIAWCEAGILEFGALTLAVIRPKGLLLHLTAKLTSVFIILLTLFVLHNGIQTVKGQSARKEEALQGRQENLSELKNLTLKQLELTPESHLSKRQLLISKLETIHSDLAVSLTKLSASMDVTRFTGQAYADTAVRIALVLLNLIFGNFLISFFKKEAYV